MQVINSYIFIKKDNNNKGNSLRINESIISIFETHFKINEIQKKISFKNNKIEGNFKYLLEGIKMNISYNFLCVDTTYYLDIVLNSNKINNIICLKYMNKLFLTNEKFNKYYIPIISYDYVSEYYCNKLYPLLNTFERKLRKLMFLIFTSKFKELYFEKTASEEMVNETKKRIENKNAIYRIQNYFYSIDIGTLRRFLFDKQWTAIEDEQKASLLKKDFSKIKTNNLKKTIEGLKPKSNWDRFFNNKEFSQNIEKTMETINELRNLVAHNKIVNENDFNVLNNELKNVTEEINKAIKITESVDFIKINNLKYTKIFTNILDSILEIQETIRNNYLTESIDNAIAVMKEMSKKQSAIVESFKEGINNSKLNI